MPLKLHTMPLRGWSACPLHDCTTSTVKSHQLSLFEHVARMDGKADANKTLRDLVRVLQETPSATTLLLAKQDLEKSYLSYMGQQEQEM